MSRMFSRIADFFAKKRGLTVFFYHDAKEEPIRVQYRPGELVRPPQSIAKEGYEIEGWFRSKCFTNKKLFDIRRKLLRRISLYAKWRPTTADKSRSMQRSPKK